MLIEVCVYYSRADMISRKLCKLERANIDVTRGEIFKAEGFSSLE